MTMAMVAMAGLGAALCGRCRSNRKQKERWADFVELPSKGVGYPTDHPLHNKEVVEIKYMTAKEEDILTSQTLLRKNLAIERFLQSVVLDKSIDTKTILIEIIIKTNPIILFIKVAYFLINILDIFEVKKKDIRQNQRHVIKDIHKP